MSIDLDRHERSRDRTDNVFLRECSSGTFPNSCSLGHVGKVFYSSLPSCRVPMLFSRVSSACLSRSVSSRPDLHPSSPLLTFLFALYQDLTSTANIATLKCVSKESLLDSLS